MLKDIFEKEEVLLSLQQAANQKLAFCNEAERPKREAFLKRAVHPECDFDREHRLMLYALALAPDQVGWGFKMRELLHCFLLKSKGSESRNELREGPEAQDIRRAMR